MKLGIVKRSMCLLLVLAFMLTLSPITAFAAEVLAAPGEASTLAAESVTFKTLGTNWPGYNPASDGPDATNPDTFTNSTFNRAMSYSKDMPVFDGVPEHIDAFIETYLDWVGLEGAALYATGLRDSYRMKIDTSSPAYGKLVPGGLAAADNANGINTNSTPTDFPTFNAQGQTWNTELMYQVGEVLGEEKMVTLFTQMTRNRNRHNGTDWSGLSGTGSTTIAFGVLTDMHVNPLAGRGDEGYGEDVYHMGVMANAQAEGFAGYNDGKDSRDVTAEIDDNFYTRGVISTKHPSVYTAEWFRQTANNSVSARGMYEYQIAGPLKGYASGAIMGGMTSFGRTNGIPNEASSYNILYNQISKYGYYSSPDFNAENYMYSVQGTGSGGGGMGGNSGDSMGNGYDIRYVQDRAHALALMSLANTESVRAMGTDQTDVQALYDLVKSGAYDITEEDLRNSAKGLLANMVRAGFFDEVDSEGYPKFYPYVDESRDGSTPEYKATDAHGGVADHIETAMDSAVEGIVVLKSDGSLLGVDDTVAVSGFYADTRYAPQTAYANTVANTSIKYSGETPLLSMARVVLEKEGEERPIASATDLIRYADGGRVVTIQDSAGRYLEAPDTDAGGALSFKSTTLNTGAAAKLQQFELFDMGQDAIMLRSVRNGLWVTSPSAATTGTANTASSRVTSSGWGGTTTSDTFTLSNLETMTMSNTNKVSAHPPRFGWIRHSADSYSLFGNYSESYNSTAYRMMESTTDGVFQTVAATFQTDMSTAAANRKFTINTVSAAGSEAIAELEEADAAVVFVGSHARNSAGEGRDRTSMAMGETDYERVKNVAAAYKAEGKPVIVVVRTAYPVLMQDPYSSYNIQSDPNVNVILYQSYGGRYEGRAMAQSLYGQVKPTGRMSSTWYMSDSVLPEYDHEYSIPVGAATNWANEDYVNYRFEKWDLTNADPQETGLTYMYADPAKVQYEFGYGVDIAGADAFKVVAANVNMEAPSGNLAANATFEVGVAAQSTGAQGGTEVFQLYATKIDSAYGDAAPIKKLVAFEKVTMEADAGAPTVLSLTVDPQDLAIWDVNAGDYIVEQGAYELQLGLSSKNILKTATINIRGGGAEALADLDPYEYFNVFDHSFAASDVVYEEVSKLRTATSLKNQDIVGGYSAVMSKSDGAWVAIPKVYLTGAIQVRASVATNQKAGVIELWRDAPNTAAGGVKMADINVPVTEAVYVDADGIINTQNNQQNGNVAGGVAEESMELGYKTVEATISGRHTGLHDIYLVFREADLRIDSMRLADSLSDYRVTFESNGGTAVAPIDAEEDSTITKPTNPTRNNLVFVGWYKDKELTTAWNFSKDKVRSSITLYAKWGWKGNGDIVFNVLGSNWPGYAKDYADVADTTNPETFTNSAFNQAMSYSADMPVFDGVAEHLDAYVSAYLDWVGLEGAALYATGLRDSYRMKIDTSSPAYGKLVPGGLAAADNANGINTNSNRTDFPTFNAQGQTWNTELMYQVGEVLGEEKMVTLFTQMTRNRNRHNATDWSGLRGTGSTTIAFGVLTDMHVNPLAGRGDEGYGEDVYHMGVMANAQAEGFAGYNDGKTSRDGSTSDDNFYTRAVISTKHPSVYTAEWFRQTANNSVSARGMYEFQIAGPLKGYASGAIMGGMTSFGRTNGIPNEASSYNILYNQISKYGYYSSPDFNAENHMYAVQSAGTSSMGNSYDIRYVQDRAHALALMSLANTESVRASGTNQDDVKALYDLVMSGAYGITEADLRNSAKGLLSNMVRAGLFDEVDAEGYPKHYPYVDQSNDGASAEYKQNDANGSVQEHIDTVMDAAVEGIVVLKSDGTALPDTSSEVAISGFYADTRHAPQTAYANTMSNTTHKYSGETPLLSIARLYEDAGQTTAQLNEKIRYNDGARVVTIKDNAGRYLEVPDSDAGGALTFKSTTLYTGDAAKLQQFELFDLGQDAILLRSLRNNRWVTSPNANNGAPGNTQAQAQNNFTLSNLSNMTMSTTNKVGASHPPRIGWIRHSATSYSLFGNYSENYASTAYRMMESTTDGVFRTIAATFQTDTSTAEANRKFTIDTVQQAGYEAAANANWADYAIVFVGGNARNSAGEGRDRTSMAMGETDYERVKNVAAAYKAAGKPVIVVVRAAYPVLMQDPNSTYNIQSDPNVNIILYQSYGGRYEGRAMAKSIYGEVIPSGRMSSTWYMSDSVLPEYDFKYSVPVGAATNYSNPSYVNPRFQKYDLTNADPQETGLTYMYADPADVQYEFGYGKHIAGNDFGIPDDTLSINPPASASADTPFNVQLTAQNMGNSAGIEVFQIYATKINSAYGDASPKKRLVAFAKDQLDNAADPTNMTLTIDPQDLAIWDVNRGEYVVEEGAYELQLGYSSEDIRKTYTINITGGGAAPVADLDPTADYFNVFDHSFATNDVVYEEVSKLRTAQSLKNQDIVGGYSAVMSKGDGAWVAIPNVNLEGVTQVRAAVATNKAPGVIELWRGGENATSGGTKLAEFTVPLTEGVYVDADGILNTQNNQQNANVEGGVQAESMELGYTIVSASITGAQTGVDDLYVVFKAADLRIDSLRFFTEAPTSRTVTFNSNGGSAVAPATVQDGMPVAKPADPSKTDSKFAGWYKDSGLNEAWNFTADRVTANITLYAKWNTLYTVSFNSNDGSSVSSVQAEDGSVIAKPEDPSKAGFFFGGWYKDSGLTEAWNFASDKVTGAITLYAKWNVPVSAVSVEPSTVTLEVGGTATLTATVLPDEAANKNVTWTSSNTAVATVSPSGVVTAVAPGTATITATAADGSAYSDTTEVTVNEPAPPLVPLITVDQNELSVAFGQTAQVTVSTDPVDAAWVTMVMNAAEDAVSTAITASASGGKITVTGGNTAGTVWLWIISSVYPDVFTRVRVNVFDSQASLKPAQFNLDTTTVTVPLYKEDPTSVAVWQERVVAQQTYRGWGTGKTLEFVAESDKNTADAQILNDYFIVEPGTTGELTVRFNPAKNVSELKKTSYKAKIAVYEGANWLQEIKGTLTVKTSKTLPSLKAPALVINTWYDDWSSDDIRASITGASVGTLKLNPAKSQPVWLNTANLETAGIVTTTQIKASGSMYLLADLDGWWQDAQLTLKVSAAATAPKVKLSASSVALFADFSKTQGTALKLLSNNSKVPYEALGITGLTLDNAKYGDLGFNADTGEFTLQAIAAPVKETLTLKATFFGRTTPLDVKLNVTVVPANKAVTLKPSKSTVTINSYAAAQDAVTVTVNPSIADLLVGADTYSTEVIGENIASLPIDVDVAGRDITFSANANTAARGNKTYKVKITWPGISNGKDASTTISVKTTNAAPALKTAVKGSIDITKGLAATVTVTPSNYSGAITPIWSITGPAAYAGADVVDNFEITDLGANKYSFALAENKALLPGTYKVTMNGDTVGGTQMTAAKAFSLKVVASKPKVTLSTSSVTLYKSDAYSEGNIIITLPAGTANISGVGLKASSGSGNFNVKYLGGGQVAIGFANQSVPNTSAKSVTLTLNIYLEGNEGAAAATTASVKVTLK